MMKSKENILKFKTANKEEVSSKILDLKKEREDPGDAKSCFCS